MGWLICNYFIPVQYLLNEFPKLCSEKKELFVLKCWCCIVPTLGEVCDEKFFCLCVKNRISFLMHCKY